MKYGFNKVFGDFVETMIQVKSHGVLMDISGSQKLIYGKLIYVICDHHTAHAMAGFEQSSSFNLKPCHTCYSEQDVIKNHCSRYELLEVILNIAMS